MQYRSLAIRFILPASAAFVLNALPAAGGQHSLKEFVQSNLLDISAKLKVVTRNDSELKKMGKSYVEANKLGERSVQFKEPNKARLQGKKGLFTIRYITNGNRKLTEVPTLRIRDVDDLTKDPAKGDSVYDLGLITSSWVDKVEDRYLRSEERDGKTFHVFEFFFKEDRAAKHTILVDPTTKTIADHTAHHRAKKKAGFKKRIVYSDVQNINGVNVPTRANLVNGENKIAAILRYDQIQVNTGLSDKLFSF